MDEFDEILKKSRRKYLQGSFEYINEINENKTFIASSEIEIVNNTEFNVNKGISQFQFEVDNLNVSKNLADHKNSGFGFNYPIILKSNGKDWILPKGSPKINLTIGKSLEAKGEIHEIHHSFSEAEKKYLRLVLPISSNGKNPHHHYIEGERFAVGSNLKAGGLTDIICDEILFNLFDYHDENKNYLFIDCMDSIFSDEFEKSIEAIIYCLGIITGSLLRNEMYILQSSSNQFETISGFKYKKLPESILDGPEIVSPLILSQVMNTDFMTGFVTRQVLSNMSTNAKKDRRFFRALKIVAESSKFPLEIRASAYSVALETMKNIVIEENAERINPFKNSAYGKKIAIRLKKIIEEEDDFNFNNKESVLKRLDQINQVTNKDSLKLAFTLNGFKLMKEDENALSKRNDFLHGRIPFEDETILIQDKELRFVTYKLHFLVTSLIMKYCKFSGLIKNNPKFLSVYSSKNKEIDEPLFRGI